MYEAPKVPLSKTENSLDLAHYLLEDVKVDELKKYDVGVHPRTEKAQFVLGCHKGLRVLTPYLRGSLQTSKIILKF